MVRVKVEGVEAVARSIERKARLVADALDAKARAMAPQALELLRATIQHVVYDAYEPQVYQRRRDQPLIRATKQEVRTFVGGGARGTTLELFNDPSVVQPTKPKGGSSAVDVPWEIETGEYPSPWYGFWWPRPAWQMTADVLQDQAVLEAEDAVRAALR